MYVYIQTTYFHVVICSCKKETPHLLWTMLLLMEEILCQLIWKISHDLQGFIHPRWLPGFLPSPAGLPLQCLGTLWGFFHSSLRMFQPLRLHWRRQQQPTATTTANQQIKNGQRFPHTPRPLHHSNSCRFLSSDETERHGKIRKSSNLNEIHTVWVLSTSFEG